MTDISARRFTYPAIDERGEVVVTIVGAPPWAGSPPLGWLAEMLDDLGYEGDPDSYLRDEEQDLAELTLCGRPASEVLGADV